MILLILLYNPFLFPNNFTALELWVDITQLTAFAAHTLGVGIALVCLYAELSPTELYYYIRHQLALYTAQLQANLEKKILPKYDFFHQVLTIVWTYTGMFTYTLLTIPFYTYGRLRSRKLPKSYESADTRHVRKEGRTYYWCEEASAPELPYRWANLSIWHEQALAWVALAAFFLQMYLFVAIGDPFEPIKKPIRTATNYLSQLKTLNINDFLPSRQWHGAGYVYFDLHTTVVALSIYLIWVLVLQPLPNLSKLKLLVVQLLILSSVLAGAKAEQFIPIYLLVELGTCTFLISVVRSRTATPSRPTFAVHAAFLALGTLFIATRQKTTVYWTSLTQTIVTARADSFDFTALKQTTLLLLTHSITPALVLVLTITALFICISRTRHPRLTPGTAHALKQTARRSQLSSNSGGEATVKNSPRSTSKFNPTL